MTESDTTHIKRHDIAEAVGLLTRLPVVSSGTRGVRAGWAWPLAGALVALIAGSTGGLAVALGLPAALSAALVLAVMVVLTGAMHEDGLADCADGFWGGWTPESRLEIMADSRIGTYGVVALVLSLLVRWTAIVALMQAETYLGALVAVAALSRVPMLALMWKLPGARPGGLSDRTGRPARDSVLLASAMALLVALLVSGFAALAGALGIAAVTWAAGRLALTKIGGQTGDVLGATQQLAEVAGLMIFAVLVA